MATFNNLNELFTHLKGQIADSMKGEVLEVVKDVQQYAIDEEVYNKYNVLGGAQVEPYVYERRREKGGLQDRKNMQETVTITSNGVEMSVQNITTGKDDSFEIADLIEYGDGHNGKEYSYKENRDGTFDQYLNPRPFMGRTLRELENYGLHIDALKADLENKGIKFK